MDTISYERLHESQKEYFDSGRTLDLAVRISHLKKLKRLVLNNMPLISEALKKDLGKQPRESLLSEISGVVAELSFTIKKTKKFSKGKKVRDSLAVFPSRGRLVPRPKGQVLILSPWNYPFLLTMKPIVSALAAGNVVIFKPSELSPATSSLMIKLINEHFDERLVRGIEGGVDESNRLLSLKFDHIFFTGSTQVGKIIYEKAAQTLTPVTLELGGKSPCIIDRGIDLQHAVKKIVWAKLMNCGQTCVAPDYVLIPREDKERFVEAFKYWTKEFYGSSPETSSEFGSVVSIRHTRRLAHLIKDQKILFGGTYDVDKKRFSPTLVDVSDLEASIMKEEIFGPVLAIVPYESTDDIMRITSKNKNPLALYVFSDKPAWRERLLAQINSGGAVINDLIIHLAQHNLPFGGVGDSGIGSYHGVYGLECFSHMRAELTRSSLKLFDNPLRYPPYTAFKEKIIKFIFGL